MKREEAIEVYNGLLNQKIKEAFEFFAPELRESEDERIRRWLVELVENQMPKVFIEVKKPDVFRWLEKQKEQKPVQTADEKEYIRIIKSLIADFIRDKKPEYVAYYQKIYDWLDGISSEKKTGPISCSHENGSPAEVCYGPKGDPDPADTPEYEYIRKDAILERIKERLKLYDPDDPDEEAACYELQLIISWLDGNEERK